jgi:hypothetical protein
MYKVYLFQYKSQFNSVFNVNPGNQGSSTIFFIHQYIVGHCWLMIVKYYELSVCKAKIVRTFFFWKDKMRIHAIKIWAGKFTENFPIHMKLDSLHTLEYCDQTLYIYCARKPDSWHSYAWLRIFVVVLNPSRQMPRFYLKLDCDWFHTHPVPQSFKANTLTHPFLFIMNQVNRKKRIDY